MIDNVFVCCKSETCLFVKTEAGLHLGERTYVMVHVNDALVVGSPASVLRAKQAMQNMFELCDMGSAKHFLGSEIAKAEDGGYELTQKRYVADLLAKFQMTECKPKSTPLAVGDQFSKSVGTPLPPDNRYAELVGFLLYLSTNTRPDICHSVSVLTRFMSAPTDKHWEAGKRIVRYLSGTAHLGLKFSGSKPKSQLDNFAQSAVLYTDADFAADVDKRRSTTGTVLMVNGTAVLWSSKLQSVVATSTTESELIAACMGVKDALWVRKLLYELCGAMGKVRLMVDNQSALILITQPTAGQSARTKHIDIQYHFVKERYTG